jgi:hypothetical protein
MYRTSRDNPYTPDIDITHLYILLYLNKGNGIPSHLLNYPPLTIHLTYLESKEYTVKFNPHHPYNPKVWMWKLGLKGVARISIYNSYNSVVPSQLSTQKTPEAQLISLRHRLIKSYPNRQERSYLHSYESLLVYQLNQALMKTQP